MQLFIIIAAGILGFFVLLGHNVILIVKDEYNILSRRDESLRVLSSGMHFRIPFVERLEEATVRRDEELLVIDVDERVIACGDVILAFQPLAVSITFRIIDTPDVALAIWLGQLNPYRHMQGCIADLLKDDVLIGDPSSINNHLESNLRATAADHGYAVVNVSVE